MYALTGCDTCCALFGIGEKKAFKTMMNYSAELQGLTEIGKEHPLSLTAWLACVSCVGLLYGCNGCLSLNKLRVNRVLENKKMLNLENCIQLTTVSFRMCYDTVPK